MNMVAKKSNKPTHQKMATWQSAAPAPAPAPVQPPQVIFMSFAKFWSPETGSKANINLTASFISKESYLKEKYN
jgi:hypothetical protein